MRGKNFGDRRRRVRRDNEIEIAHDLFAAAIASRDADMQRIIQRAQIVLQRLRFDARSCRAETTRRASRVRDRAGEFFLRRLAEARQLRHAIRFTGRLKVRDRADLQLFVQGLDLFRAQAGKRKSWRMSSGKFRAQFVEDLRRTGLDQFLDFRGDRLSDARNFLQRLRVAQLGELPPQVSIERAAFVKRGS